MQEDPLSGKHEWNVHLNVLLLTEDPSSFEEARAVWGGGARLSCRDGQRAL